MINKFLITVASIAMVLVLLVFDANTNSTNLPTGYTGAPGEMTCGAAGCHSTNSQTSAQFFLGISGNPSTYTINQVYNSYISFGVSAPLRSFQLTAVDANGNGIGSFTLSNPGITALASGTNGRQYVTPDTASSLGAWAFRWTAPSAYIGKAYFYATGIGANNNGASTGDAAYYLVDSLLPAQISGGVIANFNSNSSSICVGETVTFTNASQGSVANYIWNFGTGASPATASTAGPHSVTYSSIGTKTVRLIVNDGASAIDTVIKTITVVAGATANAGANDTICVGESTTLTATGGGSYEWSNGPTTASNTVSPLTTTTYTVTVTSGACSATDDVTVVVNSLPNVSAGADTTVCLGDTVTKVASGADIYIWVGQFPGQTIIGVPPTVGVLPIFVDGLDTITGCASSDTAIITVVDVSVSLSDTNTCAGSRVTLDAGNPGATYLWSTTEVSQTIDVTVAGVYTVTVTNSNGCSAVDSAEVLFNGSLPVSLTDTTLCPGDSIWLDAGFPGATYVWSHGPTTQTTKVGAGQYSVTVVSSGCSGSDVADVLQANLPPLDAGNNAAICAGGTVRIGNADSVGVGTYSWTPTTGLDDPNAAVTDASPTTTTTYYLTASNSGCSHTDSVTVTVNAIPNVALVGITGPYCVNDNNTYILGGTPSGGTFSGPGLSGGSVVTRGGPPGGPAGPAAVFTPSAAGAGTHTLVYNYTDGNNCSASDTLVVVVNPLPGSTITNVSAEYCIGASPDTLVGAPAGGTFFGTALTGLNIIDPSLLVGGTYTIGYTYSDAAGCADTFTTTIDIVDVTVSFTGLSGPYCASTSGSVTLTGSRSSGTFSGPGVTGNVFSPMQAGGGTHTIVYTFDTLTCSVSSSQTITVDGVYILNNDTAICEGESIILTAAGGSLYSWSNGQTGVPSITVSPTDTTMYVVSGTSGGGCTSFDTVFVYVNPNVTATLSGLSSFYCSAQAADTVVVSPAGGTLAGSGLVGNVFDPSTAPIGGPYPITYTYTNIYGCTDVAQLLVEVVASPATAIAGLDTAYCFDALAVTMVGTPAGGTFSGNGVSGNTFVPYYAGVGTHSISYTVVDPTGSGCDAVTTVNVTVNALTNPSFNALDAAYCVNDSAVALVGSPAGGTFSGVGVTGNSFNPATAGVGGPYIIEYSYTNPQGCTNSTAQITEVVAIPTLNWVGIRDEYCENDDFVVLNAFPAGGTFSGTGVNSVSFYPSVAGVGTHTLSYSYSVGSCSNTITLDVEVFAVPTASITNLDTVYCENADLVILNVSPKGGTFSGIGTTGGVFTPSTAGAGGPYTVGYTYTDANGCSSTASVDVIVNPSANTIITGLDADYCVYDNIPRTIAAYPVGGTVTGAGIDGLTFNPNEAGVGTHIIVYEYTNSLGCTSYSSVTVVVDACVGINSVAENAGSVSIYPNPTSGVVYLSFDGINGKADLDLYGINGQLLYHSVVDKLTGNSVIPMELGQFEQGVYIVKVTTETEVFTHKVILE